MGRVQALRKSDLKAIYEHGCCSDHNHPAPVNEDENADVLFDKEAERIARGLYNGTITSGSIDPAMTRRVAEHLRVAVIQGFGRDLPDLDYGTPDYMKLVQLEKNIYHFSGAKNYQQLKSMSLALKDENGLQREFPDFKKEALKINGVYNGAYLRTEYDTAIGAAQMASEWVNIEQNKDVYPFLEFEAILDSQTTDLCRRLHGTLLPWDHPFWKIYYPPNHFNERARVRQRSGGVQTQNIPEIEIQDMFRTNLAESGFIFPEKHSYFKDCPPSILKQALLMRKNAYSPLPKTNLMKSDVFVSSLADEKELQQNIQLSRRMAEHNTEVYIRPHSMDKNMKNPELQLGSLKGDFKVDPKLTSLEKFVRNAIDGANKQAANIPVIVITEDRYNKTELWRALKGELNDPSRKRFVSHVWLLLDKQLVKLTRAQIAKGSSDLLP